MLNWLGWLLVLFVNLLQLPFDFVWRVFKLFIIGLGEPKLVTWTNIRVAWKQLRGQEPVSAELTVVQGYMYTKYIYADGTEILDRGR